MMRQRCIEADRLYGSSQSFHIKARGKGLPFFKLLKKMGKFEWIECRRDVVGSLLRGMPMVVD
jgi:hypothetical protein